jgi:hypothetical protein
MGLASSLLKRRKTEGEIVLWSLERTANVEDLVVKDLGAEVKVETAPPARKAARRMRCLSILVSPRSYRPVHEELHRTYMMEDAKENGGGGFSNIVSMSMSMNVPQEKLLPAAFLGEIRLALS